MTNELTARWKFAVMQVIVGSIAPLLYVQVVTFSFSNSSLGAFGYWLIFPFLCFLFLAGVAFPRSQEQFLVSRSALWRAAKVAYLIYLLPLVLLGISSATYSGGGANIGIGILFIIAPIALPISMYIGLFVWKSRS